MRNLIVASVLLILGCGTQEEPIVTTESAIVSTDPCGVTVSPYNAVCTKHTSWKCTSYNSTTHRCWRAHGTTPIPGTYWAYRGTHPDFEVDGNIAWYPGRGTTIDAGDDGNDNVMVFTKGTSVTSQGPLITSGWSYNNTDLTPSGAIYGLETFVPVQFIVYGGDYGISFCGYTGANFTGQIGADCFRAGPDDVTVWDMSVYGYPTIRSFQTF